MDEIDRGRYVGKQGSNPLIHMQYTTNFVVTAYAIIFCLLKFLPTVLCMYILSKKVDTSSIYFNYFMYHCI